MQVSLNTTSATRRSPAFGKFLLNDSSKAVLRRLSPEQLLEYEKLEATQLDSPVDINLIGRPYKYKKLDAVIIPNYYTHLNEVHCSQSFFESTNKFLARCCKIADNFRAEIEALVKRGCI